MTHVAVLDKSGVLIGYTDKKTPTDTDIVVPAADLEIGRYRWDTGTFVPIVPDDPAEEFKVAPDALRTLNLLIDVVRKSGVVMPKEVTAWQRWYQGTIDSSGTRGD